TSFPTWLKLYASGPTDGMLTVPLSGVLSYTTPDGVDACAIAGANNVAPVRPASANESSSLFKVPSLGIDAAESAGPDRDPRKPTRCFWVVNPRMGARDYVSATNGTGL